MRPVMPPAAVLERRRLIRQLASRHRYGDGVRVGIIDSGLCLEPNEGEFEAERIELVSGPDTLQDNLGHGTAVASLIAGRTLGVSPACSLWVAKCEYRSADHSSVESVRYWIAEAMKARVDVLNISLGTQMPSPKLRHLCEQADASGMLLVAAAGNDRKGSLRYPAALATVISVGAVTYDDERLSVSNYDASSAELDLVDFGEDVIVASRVSVLSTVTGTSFAAAQVSGLLALAIAAARRADCPTVTRERLLAAGSELCYPIKGSNRRMTGCGRLHVQKLLEWATQCQPNR